jgi:hypothetical protein
VSDYQAQYTHGQALIASATSKSIVAIILQGQGLYTEKNVRVNENSSHALVGLRLAVDDKEHIDDMDTLD